MTQIQQEEIGNGIITVPSAFDWATCVEKVVGLLEEKGLKVFSKVDHAAAAATVDENLNPTVLILFGNPKMGTPLMQAEPLMGLDLPQKILVWQDREQQVWVSYNDPFYLKKRHQVSACDPLIEKMSKGLAAIVEQVTLK